MAYGKNGEGEASRAGGWGYVFGDEGGAFYLARQVLRAALALEEGWGQPTKLYDMLPADAGDTSEGRTPATNATVRTVFVIGPDKKIKLMLSYPMSTGRNFDEVLRVLDSIQLTTKHKVATPVNWKQGDDVIILTSVGEEEAKQKFPGGWKTLKPYLRIVPQPK